MPDLGFTKESANQIATNPHCLNKAHGEHHQLRSIYTAVNMSWKKNIKPVIMGLQHLNFEGLKILEKTGVLKSDVNI